MIAFCARLHPRNKLRGRVEKWLLRRVAERFLPRQVSRRRKHGFHATFALIFLGADRPRWVDELLSPPSLHRTGYFEPSAVGRVRALLTRRRIRPHYRLDIGMTAVVATQLWHHLFCGGGLAELPTWSSPGLSCSREAPDSFPAIN